MANSNLVNSRYHITMRFMYLFMRGIKKNTTAKGYKRFLVKEGKLRE